MPHQEDSEHAGLLPYSSKFRLWARKTDLGTLVSARFRLLLMVFLSWTDKAILGRTS
jgi:hypothetical protein